MVFDRHDFEAADGFAAFSGALPTWTFDAAGFPNGYTAQGASTAVDVYRIAKTVIGTVHPWDAKYAYEGWIRGNTNGYHAVTLFTSSSSSTASWDTSDTSYYYAVKVLGSGGCFVTNRDPYPGTEVDDSSVQYGIPVSFDISLDTVDPLSIEVTGTTPGVTTPGGPVIGVTPAPGGVDVTTPDGTVHIPLPGGTPNGPVTIRVDGHNVYVIYDGAVIYVYTLSPSDYSALAGPSTYVGIYDPLAGTVTSNPSYPPVYPPLGGWRYVLSAWDYVPLGIRPRLFRVWARLRTGVSVLIHDSGLVEFVQGISQDDEADPTVRVYRGGFDHLIDGSTATQIAAAGGLEWLTEVPTPAP